MSNLNIEIKFCYGTAPENLGEMGKYQKVDIVLSFSLVAGLHANWKSGSLLIPDHFIPFSLGQVILSPSKQYWSRNHLRDALLDVIGSQSAEVLTMVNEQFGSFNPQKNHLKARTLLMEDFKEAVLLQVDGLFNPSRLPSHFNLESVGHINR